MSQYTMEVREIVENNINIFDNMQYPLFDMGYKDEFEKKFIDHFYFREIGSETVGRFIFNLRVKLNEIMPYYNKLYETTLFEQRIMDNYDVTETFTKTNSTEGTVNNDGTNVNKKLHSDTPQGRIDFNDGQYVSDIGQDTEEIDTTTTTSATDTENWTRTMSGNIGIQTDANAIEQYRASLINVDLMIFNELNELFMGVY